MWGQGRPTPVKGSPNYIYPDATVGKSRLAHLAGNKASGGTECRLRGAELLHAIDLSWVDRYIDILHHHIIRPFFHLQHRTASSPHHQIRLRRRPFYIVFYCYTPILHFHLLFFGWRDFQDFQLMPMLLLVWKQGSSTDLIDAFRVVLSALSAWF